MLFPPSSSRAPVGPFAAGLFAGIGRFTRLTHWSLKNAPGFSRDIRTEFVKNWCLFIGLLAGILIIVSEGLLATATVEAAARMWVLPLCRKVTR
jgi:hypothetical protein